MRQCELELGSASHHVADVPEKRCNEQRYQHAHRGAAVGRGQHLGRNQLDQRIGHRDAAEQNTQEIEKSR